MEKLIKSITFLLLFSGLFSCVQKTIKRHIHVELDMRGVDGVESVGIRGQYPPLSWNSDIELQDPDADGIYTGSFVLDFPYDFFEYKFVANGEQFELQGEDNRRFYVKGETAWTLEAVFNQK